MYARFEIYWDARFFLLGTHDRASLTKKIAIFRKQIQQIGCIYFRK